MWWQPSQRAVSYAWVVLWRVAMSAVTAMAKATAAEMETATCKNAAALPNYSLMLQPTLQLWLPLSLPLPLLPLFVACACSEYACVCVCVCCINQLEVGCSTKLWFTIYRCLYLAHPLSLPLLQSVLCSSPHIHTHAYAHTAHSYALQTVIWLFDPTWPYAARSISNSVHFWALARTSVSRSSLKSCLLPSPPLSIYVSVSLSVCAYRCDVDVDVTLCCTYATAAAASSRTAACCMRVSLSPLPLSLFRSLSVALCVVEKVKRRNLCLSP